MRALAFLTAALLSLAGFAEELAFEGEPGFAGAEGEVCAYDRWAIGTAANLTLPQGGSRLRRLGGGAARVGYYVTEMLAVEGEAAWLEDRAGLAVRGLWHWWGYERLDPFFTFGAQGWLPEGQVGPTGGIGTFYHLDDHLSLRFDCAATLGVETRCEMIYGFGVGVQYTF